MMITIFAGAGASKALDYPTTIEFFASGSGESLRTDPVFEKVSTFFNKRSFDVEDVLRLLDPFAQLDATPTGNFIFPHLQNHWLKSVPSFVDKTNKVCFNHYGRRPSEELVQKTYIPLLKILHWETERVNFFTTNYDPVTDVLMEIAENSSILCSDGFNRFGDWDKDAYYKLNSSGISIYRLHGSMSWVENEGKIRNTRDYSLRSPGYARHLIIYPGFKDNIEQDCHPIFRFAHEALRNELNETSVLIVIGFSFRDPHINDILHDSLKANRKLKIVVWNPTWPEGQDVGLNLLKQRFTNRIIHLEAKFGDEGAFYRLQDLLK